VYRYTMRRRSRWVRVHLEEEEEVNAYGYTMMNANFTNIVSALPA
jgi:hypothetical protein